MYVRGELRGGLRAARGVLTEATPLHPPPIGMSIPHYVLCQKARRNKTGTLTTDPWRHLLPPLVYGGMYRTRYVPGGDGTASLAGGA